MQNQAQTIIPQGNNNFSEMIKNFSEFKKTMVGKNPQQIVENLLSSGKMSQEQFTELKKQADMLSTILK